MSSSIMSAVPVARMRTPLATLAPWSNAIRAPTWFDANRNEPTSRIGTPTRSGSLEALALTETVLALDVGRIESAQARMQAAPRGGGEQHRDLARPGRIVQGDAHGVVM